MTQTSLRSTSLVRAATLVDLQAKGQLLVHLNHETIALFYSNERVYAIDNRCPHLSKTGGW